MSSIKIVALVVPLSLMPYGKYVSIIAIENISSFSDIVSSIIGIEESEEAQVAPAGNVKLYILLGGT